jgi:signal transduction histidine kinase
VVGLVGKAVTSQASQPFHECDLTTATGRVRHVGVIVSIVRDQNNEPLGISVLINDLTEVSELRHELEQKTRLSAMGEMAGGLAHQLRNSMGAISGYAKLIARRIQNGTAEPGSVTALADEIHQTESLVSRFLNFVRPLDISLQKTNIAEVVRDVVAAFKVRHDCSDIVFDICLSDEIAADVDRLLIKQVLTNLIENAVLASNGRGEITVTLDPIDSGELSLSVQDRGSGIPAEQIDRIFTPFYSSRPSGSGLGLALSSKIVDMHGGRIKVSSRVGEGSVFTVILPLSRQSQLQA